MEKWEALATVVFFYGFSGSTLIPKLITVDVITAIVLEVKTKCAALEKKIEEKKKRPLRGGNTTDDINLSLQSRLDVNVKSVTSAGGRTARWLELLWLRGSFIHLWLSGLNITQIHEQNKAKCEKTKKDFVSQHVEAFEGISEQHCHLAATMSLVPILVGQHQKSSPVL